MRGSKKSERGKLRIGDDWNAITIIALSQSNPLKAIAEFVENSIDAHAREIVVTRGREHGEHYLAIRDDGDGVPRDEQGLPDFRYVATHICDSLKRRLKADGAAGLQGEFGIGLLSFWTVGDELTMTSTGTDQRAYQMSMRKGDPSYAVAPKRTLFAERGTELKIAPLLDGVRNMSGEKIQWYLAAELRDRIRHSGVRITVLDRLARKQFAVEPRQYEGRLLHQLPPVQNEHGDSYVELYLNEPADGNKVALFRNGTRVLEDLAVEADFARAPWTSRYLQGHVDAPFVNLTPGTRSGIIRDRAYSALLEALAPLEARLSEVIDEQRRAEEDQASRETMRSIQRAFREALLALPAEEYDWFDIQTRVQRPASGLGGGLPAESDLMSEIKAAPEPAGVEPPQRNFFEFAGPLFAVLVSPASAIVRIGDARALKALPRDRSRRRVADGLTFAWSVVEGGGTLENPADQGVNFRAPPEPGLTRIGVKVTQREVNCEAEALITVTQDLPLGTVGAAANAQGLPGYTYERAPGQLWRSRFDSAQNLIVVNNGHRDFVFAARNKQLKLRYLVRLFAKELVLRNFPGLAAEQLLERMVELTMRVEEALR